MDSSKKNRSSSLNAFIEKTARMLREATKMPPSKEEKYRVENGLTNTNKISQIALLIRSEVKKRKSRKKNDS